MTDVLRPSAASLKPGYGLFLWSAHRGCWCVQFVSEDRARLEGVRSRLSLFHGLQELHPTITEALSIDDADIELAGGLLDPPAASFVDPAPDGLLATRGAFDELVQAVMLEVEFSGFRSELWWQSAGDLPADVTLRSLFAHRLIIGSQVSDVLMPMARG